VSSSSLESTRGSHPFMETSEMQSPHLNRTPSTLTCEDDLMVAVENLLHSLRNYSREGATNRWFYWWMDSSSLLFLRGGYPPSPFSISVTCSFFFLFIFILSTLE
ncbi:hypothetical protein PENTCL1PPCAC_11796, partial [Pristionchus entomophagus]